MSKPKHYHRYILFFSMLAAGMLLLAACSPQGTGEETLTAADFGVPAEAADHEHDEESTSSEFDPSMVETGDEGVFIDHHGNRVVDELYQNFEQDNLKLEFTVENFLGVGGRGGEVTADIRAGERALIKFKVSDIATEQPLSGLRPFAWLELQEGGHIDGDQEEQEAVCKQKVEGYLSGMLTSRPTVDLNSFFILALNDDPSISVIDPTVDVAGMTQLFALIQLNQPGEDWALTSDQNQLFVTIPATNQVAVAEMDGFDVAQHIDAGINPMRIAIQPDQIYVWVGNDSDRKDQSGVTVIDPATRQTVSFIPTGAGHHELAFSTDSQYAFITNSAGGSLTIIDTRTLEVIADLKLGRQPLAVAISEASEAIYVADAATGTISVIDQESMTLVAEIETDPGLAALQFAPGGRWAFAANPSSGKIIIIDATDHTITHIAQVGGAPDQISFSQNAAYIRSRDAARINVVQLTDLSPDSELELASVPVGTLPPGQYPSLPLAPGMSSVSKQQAIVIANPVDDQVYFFPEGATSPSGSFQGHSLRPRAVTVVDRSLREDAPGVYSGRIRIPDSGTYLVAIMLNDPFVVHCFEFEARTSELLTESAIPELILMNEGLTPTAGEPFNLRFQLLDPQTGAGLDGIEDALIMATMVAGNWNTRQAAISIGEGMYEVTLSVPQPGLYSIFFAVPSLGITPNRVPSINLQVADGS
ncbi:MAG: YncE family protein [Anaerolineales bacterium]|nr:YncE family protein [Anaerolineales bacterium]